MTSRNIVLALATSAAMLSPVLAPQAAAQAACTQLERSAGLSGAECGRLTIAELAVLHTDRAGG